MAFAYCYKLKKIMETIIIIIGLIAVTIVALIRIFDDNK